MVVACGCGDRAGSGAVPSDAGGDAGFELEFVCGTYAGTEAACPVGQECPLIPLGSGGCDYLPSCGDYKPCNDLLAALPAEMRDAGYPPSCQVELPQYVGSHWVCYCGTWMHGPLEWVCLK